MKQEVIQRLHSSFEDAANNQDGVEFWYARDLQVLLEYQDWRNFQKVIEKAGTACHNSGQRCGEVEEARRVNALGCYRSLASYKLARTTRP